MSKFHGKLGFASFEETAPSVITEVITERTYSGNVLRNTRRWVSGENLNDNLEVTNTISVVADGYAMDNFHSLRYVWWMGARWKAASVDRNYPRLNITLGGVYNGHSGPTRPDPESNG